MQLREGLQTALGSSYTVEREIDGGGMSHVFLARDTQFNRDVVVKLLRPELASSVSVERFKREIDLAATLQHPHIVPLLAAGHVDGLPFYTMPFVRGESLRMRLSRSGECSIGDAVHILRDVASALAHAHGENVVHRDIKPENILLSGGVAVVTDFGVAKAMDVATVRSEGVNHPLTSAGVALGTPAYMSPEQASADPLVDHRSDIYSFGCVAYELLSGSGPFGSRSPQHMLVAHMAEDPVPLGTRRPTTPDRLAALVMRCLEKRPADRPQSAVELIAALDDITTNSGGSPATVFSVSRWRRVAVVIGGVVVLAAVGFGLAWRRAEPFYVAGRATNLVSTSDVLELDPAISPDGKFVAYAAGPDGSRRIHVRQIAGGSTLELTGALPGDHRWPRWSPDGTTLLFSAPRHIYSIPAFGGRPTTLARTEGSRPMADWSPNADAFVVASNDTLSIHQTDGSAPVPIMHDVVRSGAENANAPAWSPDGRFIAFARGNASYITSPGNMAPSAVWIARADGSGAWPVTDSSRLNSVPVWTPDGRTLLFVSDRDGTRDVYAQALHADGRPRGAPRRITSGLHAYSLSLTGDGSRLVYSVLLLRRNVWSAPVGADRPTSFTMAHQVTWENHTVEGLAVSRDGRWLLYDTNRDGNEDIFKLALYDSARTPDPIRLTRDPADDFLARFSPSGSEIVFYSTRFGTRDIFVMTAEGTNVSRVTDLATDEIYPDWSPDGTQIVFGSPLGTRNRVMMVRRSGHDIWSRPRELVMPECGGSPPHAVFPRWSPDGRWIAVPCGSSVALLSPDSASPHLVHLPGLNAWYVEWGGHPNVLFVKEYPNGQIWAVALPSGQRRLLLRRDDSPRVAPRQEFATDGKRLYFTLATDEADIWIMDLTRQR